MNRANVLPPIDTAFTKMVDFWNTTRCPHFAIGGKDVGHTVWYTTFRTEIEYFKNRPPIYVPDDEIRLYGHRLIQLIQVLANLANVVYVCPATHPDDMQDALDELLNCAESISAVVHG